MSCEHTRNLQIYNDEILLMAQLKAQGTNESEIRKADPEAAAKFSFLETELYRAGVMPQVEALAEKIRRKLADSDSSHAVPKVSIREPKKIPPPMWYSDPLPLMQIIATRRNPNKPLQKALGSDARHEVSEQHKKLRQKLGLPEKAPLWKEMLQQFHDLTEEDKNILSEMGYHPDEVTNPYSLTVECMLRDLERYKNSSLLDEIEEHGS